jgi:hypothetical protein
LPSVEQVVREFEAFIRRKNFERSKKVPSHQCVAEAAIGYHQECSYSITNIDGDERLSPVA